MLRLSGCGREPAGKATRTPTVALTPRESVIVIVVEPGVVPVIEHFALILVDREGEERGRCGHGGQGAKRALHGERLRRADRNERGRG